MIWTNSREGPERCAPDPHIASKPVSRVLSFKTAIYLDAPLPARSSHLPGTAGPAICPSTVLLRIEFTAMGSLQPSGELLPRLSTLTSPRESRGFRGSPFGDEAVFLCCTFPCPAEPGLSSWAAFRRCPRGCPAYLQASIISHLETDVNSIEMFTFIRYNNVC